MQQNLSCEQVNALMTFYIEDRLSAKLAEYVQQHLDICPVCREKYNKLINVIKKYSNIKNNISIDNDEYFENSFITKQYEEFKSNLSAYIDNELDDMENIKIKKITISNPLARNDLEEMYTFKKILHSSFDKTRNEFKNDFSKNIINQIQNSKEGKEIDPFIKIMTLLFTIISCIVAGIIWILYF